jgi:O-antigen/teichoic acid export membrane protein
MIDFRLQKRAKSFIDIQNRLFSDSAFLFAALMAGNGIAYLYQMVLARIMMPSEYGILVTLTSLSYVLAVFNRTFQARIIKAVNEIKDLKSEGLGLLFFSILRTLVPLGATVFVIHIMFARWVADFLRIGSMIPIIMLGFYTFSTFFAPITRGMLLGLNRLRLAGIIQILEPIARLLLGIALVNWGFGVNGALVGFAFGNVVVFFVALFPLLPLLRRPAGSEVSAVNIVIVDKYTRWVLLVNISLMVMASIDQIAIKHFFSAEIAGNYAVAFLLGQVIAMSANVLGWVLFARSANQALSSSRLKVLLAKGLFITGFIALSLTIGFLFAPRLVVGLMGGAQYNTAHTYVGLVGIEMTVFALIYIQSYFLLAMGKTQIMWPLIFSLALVIALLSMYHTTVQQVLISLISVLGGLLIYISGFSWWTLNGKNRFLRRYH